MPKDKCEAFLVLNMSRNFGPRRSALHLVATRPPAYLDDAPWNLLSVCDGHRCESKLGMLQKTGFRCGARTNRNTSHDQFLPRMFNELHGKDRYHGFSQF